MSNRSSYMKEIREYVKLVRDRNNIVLTSRRKFEPSCIAFGEMHNLFYRQLLTTPEGNGGWKELEDDSVLEEMVRFVRLERDRVS